MSATFRATAPIGLGCEVEQTFPTMATAVAWIASMVPPGANLDDAKVVEERTHPAADLVAAIRSKWQIQGLAVGLGRPASDDMLSALMKVRTT